LDFAAVDMQISSFPMVMSREPQHPSSRASAVNQSAN